MVGFAFVACFIYISRQSNRRLYRQTFRQTFRRLIHRTSRQMNRFQSQSLNQNQRGLLLSRRSLGMMIRGADQPLRAAGFARFMVMIRLQSISLAQGVRLQSLRLSRL